MARDDILTRSSYNLRIRCQQINICDCIKYWKSRYQTTWKSHHIIRKPNIFAEAMTESILNPFPVNNVSHSFENDMKPDSEDRKTRLTIPNVAKQNRRVVRGLITSRLPWGIISAFSRYTILFFNRSYLTSLIIFSEVKA